MFPSSETTISHGHTVTFLADLVLRGSRHRPTQLFPTVGFMESGDGYPWYGLTVGDDSKIYTDFNFFTGEPGIYL